MKKLKKIKLNSNFFLDDDDPLSNLINEDAYTSKTKNQPLNDARSSSKLNFNTTFSTAETRSSSFLDNFLNEERPISSENRKTVKFDESTIQNVSTRKSNNIDWLDVGKEIDEETILSRTKTDEDDWLKSGLNRRQQRKNVVQQNDLTDEKKSEKKLNSLDTVNDETSQNKVVGDELTVLKTKISILEIEKFHLNESIDKLNANHEQEISHLKQLHE